MFKLGASDPDRVDAFMYNEHDEDFGRDGINFGFLIYLKGSLLDTWVFDKFEQLFLNATRDASLNRLLRQDKIVFFLQYL